MQVKALLLSATVMMASAASASAHTAYLKPSVFFTPEASDVSVEAAYGTTFFQPAIGLSSPNLHALRPDGSRDTSFDQIAIGTNVTNLQDSIPSEGTYRFSTGEVLGPVSNMVLVDGNWRALGAGEVPPEGAPTGTLQTAIVAETFVTRVRPTEAAYAQPVGRLAIRPVTHPNRISVADGFTVDVLFDGAGFANVPLVLYAEGDPETKLDTTFVTDAAGRAHVTVPNPGRYVLAIRHRADAPAGSPAEVRSYTTTLTFEAMSVLPEIPPPPEPERRGRRRRNAD